MESVPMFGSNSDIITTQPNPVNILHKNTNIPWYQKPIIIKVFKLYSRLIGSHQYLLWSLCQSRLYRALDTLLWNSIYNIYRNEIWGSFFKYMNLLVTISNSIKTYSIRNPLLFYLFVVYYYTINILQSGELGLGQLVSRQVINISQS